MYKKVIDGKTVYSTCSSIKPEHTHNYLASGQWAANSCISNPPLDLIIAEGWEPCEVEPPILYEGHEPYPEDTDYIDFIQKHPEYKSVICQVKNGIVYHYTTWEVLFNGILCQDNLSTNKAVLRAHSINYMNDESEGLELPYMFSELEKEKYPNSANKFPGATLSRYEMYRYCARDSKQKLFSISFSHNPDSLPMWNYYGQKGKGLSIGFSVYDILNQGYNLYDCIYDLKHKKELGKCLFDNYWTGRIVNKAGLLFKDDHFDYEKECRIPILSFCKEYCLNLRNQFFPIKYDIKDGLIVPFVELYLPLTSIKEIYIGPTNSPNRAKDSLKGWLDSIGLHPQIKVSTVPLA